MMKQKTDTFHKAHKHSYYWHYKR